LGSVARFHHHHIFNFNTFSLRFVKMHSFAVAFLAAAATLSTSVRAAPTPDTVSAAVEARAAYYVCNNNGFRGDCSVDPCAISWCPDYKPYTYEPVGTVTPAPAPAPVPAPVPSPPTTPSFYVCFNNGFRGDCSVDPCAISWCPDYKPYTYTPVAQAAKRDASDPTVCAPGTGFFQSCGNGFRGCCTTDACGPAGWCPNYYFGSYTPVVQVKREADPTVCAPGTGFFQSCSNGFRGCCKSDACGQAGWCPDYKFGSYTPVAAPVVKVVEPTVETAAVVPGNNGVCPPNTGFFQVCGNGFRGCCKKDACAGKAAVCPA
jgi:hypothetical protein